MRSRRPLSVNNSLVHGICNSNCITCGVNKPGYGGPHAFQSEEVTLKLAERVLEAQSDGIDIWYIGNSGAGEPTLHPDLDRRLDIFGEMKRCSKNSGYRPPVVVVVSNGLELGRSGTWEALVRNGIHLIVSFPTSDPGHYGRIMALDPEVGAARLSRVVPNLERAMALVAAGELASLEIIIAPPYLEYTYPDFPGTALFLAGLARKSGLSRLKLLVRPKFSNRTGLLQDVPDRPNLFRRHFRRYHRRELEGVRIEMSLLTHRFYARARYFLDLFRSFHYPCLWYGNIAISPFGDGFCCNDQEIKDPQGNILTHSLREIMEIKEDHPPAKACRLCNCAIHRLQGPLALRVFRRLALLKMSLHKGIKIADS